MKFTSAIVFASVITSALALPASLLKHARRLEQNQEQQNEYTFLQGYSLKLLRCKAGETYISPVDGTYEYSSVVFRLCPSECDSSTVGGCKEGYGDYVVGLNTFTAAYLQAKREEMEGNDNNNQDGGNWKMEELGECRNYEADKDAGLDEDLAFYVGPACTEDSTGVSINMYLDETCQTPSTEYTFEQISNGVSLPFASGGLVSDNCESCYAENDRGEFELSEMCTNLYQYSGKCETLMADGTYHYMGKNEEACETIKAILPMSAKKGGKAGKVIGWCVFALVVVGIAGYAYTQHKKKQDDKRAGLMA
jgi:hypothetical protein